jgi:uncharacterized membrane protein required for colicin V production
MIFDAIVLLALVAQTISGFREGFLKSILKTVGYIAGAIGGLYLAVQYDQSAWVILAIFAGAGLGSLIGGLIAKALKLTILRGPLGWINSIVGGLLGVAKIALLTYIVGTVLLIAPWPTGQNAVSASKIYNKLDIYAPQAVSELRKRIEELIANPLELRS